MNKDGRKGQLWGFVPASLYSLPEVHLLFLLFLLLLFLLLVPGKKVLVPLGL